MTDIKVTAKLVRKDIAAAIKKGELPAIQTSVRIERYSMGQALRVRVTVVPEGFSVPNLERVRWDMDHPHARLGDAPEEARYRLSNEARELIEKLDAIVCAYHTVYASDPQTDYIHENFHKEIDFDGKIEHAQRNALQARLYK